MKNLPNILSISRFFVALAFVYFYQINQAWAVFLSTALFAGGALTDFLDGYLARKYQLSSDFGKLMDPIADKFLVLSAFFVFMAQGEIAVWMFYAIAIREVFVTASRLSLTRKGTVVAAEAAGKLKTVLQMVTIFVILGLNVLAHSTSDPSSWVFQQNTLFFFSIGTQILMILTVTLTLYSGVLYFLCNRTQLF
ncbi:MAG: CDP-diacylglycerol--glycerol-3-phosphate 3-phosphatidyltransferase [Candidatus Omnitrophica bacterium]|nr:CDP-diacylglycerol--glycerol-3-phosphate 3-phosphatidyltransferase [Candidatus Omnitrophota bacterium]